MPDRHIAQLNVGVMIAPTDDPVVAEFMDNLDRINAEADAADGFVWRLQTEQGNATDIHVFPNPLQLVNMSVWESVETLRAYVYRTEHVEFFRRRAEWFEPDGKRLVLWSVPRGTVPSLAEAVRRLEFLERHGVSPYAFGFANPPPPLLFEPADRDDALVESLMSHVSGRGGPAPEGAICARYDGRPAGVGVRLPDRGGGTEFAVHVDESVAGPVVQAALVDQLELAAELADVDDVAGARAGGQSGSFGTSNP